MAWRRPDGDGEWDFPLDALVNQHNLQCASPLPPSPGARTGTGTSSGTGTGTSNPTKGTARSFCLSPTAARYGIKGFMAMKKLLCVMMSVRHTPYPRLPATWTTP